MKNNNLKNTVQAFQVKLPTMPAHQAQLRKKLLYAAEAKQNNQINKGAFMSRHKKIMAVGSMSLATLLTVGTVSYSYRFSPKAHAQQLVSQSLVAVHAIPGSTKDALQIKLGGDPVEALEEARQAKDLRIITREEFDAEAKTAKSVLSSSLSSDPSAQTTGSVSASANATGTEPNTFSISSMGGANAAGTATFMTANNFTPGTAADGATTAPAPTPESGITTVALANPGQAVPAPDGTSLVVGGSAGVDTHVQTFQAVPVSGSGATTSSGNVTITNSATAVAGASTSATPTVFSNALPPTDIQMKFNFKEPKQYLRFTDKSGRVTVLSLDETGLPIYRTIFLAK